MELERSSLKTGPKVATGLMTVSSV
jgi:hypothetical protein